MEIGDAAVADEADQPDQDDAAKYVGGAEEAAGVEDHEAEAAIAAEQF